MAADWIGIDSTHLDSSCGDDGTNFLANALDGLDLWGHDVNETHWFILDLGEEYNVKKVRGRSQSTGDPISVNVYVSNSKTVWGAAVATGISTWQDTTSWQEVDVTDKNGRYVKIEITSTEHASGDIYFGTGGGPYTPIFDVYGDAGSAIVEAASASETQDGLITSTAAAAESASAADAQDGLAVSTVTESATASETQDGLTDRAAEIAEAASAGDGQEGTGDYSMDITEPASAGDGQDRSLIHTGGAAESASAADAQDGSRASADAVTEAAGAADASDSNLRYADITPEMQRDLIDPYSGGAWLWLCEITVPGYSTERLARNTEDVTFAGRDYEKFNLQIGEQLFSGDGSVPRVTMRIFQDVNRTIEDMVNETAGALGAEVKLIRVCEKFLDYQVAALEADYEALAAESDSEWVTFTLGVPNPLTQRYPLRIYSSNSCPWATPTLFKGPRCQYAGVDSTCTGTYEDCYQKGNAVHWGGELGLDPNVMKI